MYLINYLLVVSLTLSFILFLISVLVLKLRSILIFGDFIDLYNRAYLRVFLSFFIK